MRSAIVRITVTLVLLTGAACSHLDSVAQPDQRDLTQQLRDSHAWRR
jgi:hypothetical protein